MNIKHRSLVAGLGVLGLGVALALGGCTGETAAADEGGGVAKSADALSLKTCTQFQIDNWNYAFESEVAACSDSRHARHNYYDIYRNPANANVFCSASAGSSTEYCPAFCNPSSQPASCN